ncbi:hypothetical protein ACFPVX_01475 [Cohnella faecalis]|uniref:Uncharacterized protein n=1 Tax=Cohnella faecalis TaxID=2315694 RepID=A0A398CTU0_9BACL|nr:hypothetical protein [Cohnella faecalis]RIE04689.1 hypothetical protein D3H35_04170 [Cohnella faecalis]
MEPTDHELKELLANGPLSRHGFNDELRKRIEREISHQERRPRARLFGSAYRYGAVGALAVAILVGFWQWGLPALNGGANNELSKTSSSISDITNAAVSNEPPRAALLIGTRTDRLSGDGESTVSSYRTVLVAPSAAGLEVVADGPGLYMPYKQNFWKIDAATDSADGEQQLHSSKLSAGVKPVAMVTEPVPGLSEKLLFAGNRYVSILQTVKSAEPDGKSQTFAWVKDFDQLNTPRENKPFDPATEPHVALGEWLGTKTTEEQWAIVRQEGQWKPEKPAAGKSATDKSKWQALGTPLPELIVSYDSLGLSWEQIKQFNPKAVDAFTSPSDDILATVEEEGIVIYPFRQADPQAKSLTVKLAEGESVVMVQWALDNYVPTWKQRLGEWIPPASS